MNDKLTEIFGIKHLLPAHQEHVCEHIITHHFVKDEGLIEKSTLPFKGEIDLDKVKACIEKEGTDNIAYLRIETAQTLSADSASFMSLKHSASSQADLNLFQMARKACCSLLS